ncbi:hypothetical protein HY030_01440 [Candidatus Gottesmanbacteria bacterium]|nr:hypothetical protein [Candidatus Gottesmanbacteria bacterium]
MTETERVNTGAIFLNERLGERRALVIHNLPENLGNPDLINFLQRNRFPVKSLQEILAEDLEQEWTDLDAFEGHPAKKPIETLAIRTMNISLYGEIESTRVHSLGGGSNTKYRVPSYPIPGIEIVVLKNDGKLVYTIPLETISVPGALYLASVKSLPPVTLSQSGDALLLEEGIARKLTSAEEGTQYLYIGRPWDLKNYHMVARRQPGRDVSRKFHYLT